MDTPISFCTLTDVGSAPDAVVVIDVLRAFTTAAVVLEGQPATYELVATLDQAYARRREQPGTRLLGEVDGRMPGDFDHSNSPSELLGQDLTGVHIVHRSTSGTQGVARAMSADTILVTSFAVARATARRLRALNPQSITFCVTGLWEPRDGDEDRACGDYIAALLASSGDDVDPTPFVNRVLPSSAGQLFMDRAHDELPPADAHFAAIPDRYDFAMEVTRTDGRLLVSRA